MNAKIGDCLPTSLIIKITPVFLLNQGKIKLSYASYTSTKYLTLTQVQILKPLQ